MTETKHSSKRLHPRNEFRQRTVAVLIYLDLDLDFLDLDLDFSDLDLDLDLDADLDFDLDNLNICALALRLVPLYLFIGKSNVNLCVFKKVSKLFCVGPCIFFADIFIIECHIFL